MRKISPSILCLFFGFVLVVSGAGMGLAGESGYGQTSADVLQFGAGAAQPALGGAGVASVSSAASLHYNPAGLVRVETDEVGLTYQDLVEDIGYGSADYAAPLDLLGRSGSLGAGMRYLDYGSTDRTGWDEEDGVTDEGSFSSYEAVGSLGYAESLDDNLSLGMALRGFHGEIDDESAAAFSADVGLQWHSASPEQPISAGVVLANIGAGPEYEDESEDLPTLARFGMTYDKTADLDVNLKSLFDIEYQIEADEMGYLAGLEWTPQDYLSIRAGYDDNLDVDGGLTAGLGLTYDRNISLDYAVVPYGDFGEVHKIGLTYRL